MSFPMKKTTDGLEESKNILRCENICECLLVDDLVYGKKLDSMILTREDERFHALLKVEKATFNHKPNRGVDRTPDFHVKYSLLRLDFDKVKQYAESLIGFCDHTMERYSEIEKENIVTKIDQQEWRYYPDDTKLDYLAELEQEGKQVYGFCESCRTEWEADAKGFVPYLFERLVNKKLYIHPFIKSRHDTLDNLQVTEAMQVEYATYRLNEAFCNCVVGDTESLLNEIENCYVFDVDSQLYEPGFELSSYGSLNYELLGRVTSRFKSYTLYDSNAVVHASAKKKEMDLDITNVENAKVRGWFGGQDSHGFAVRYRRLKRTKWTRTLVLLNNAEEEEPLFALGFTTVEKANRWKMKITTEIPDKLEPKVGFEREFQEFSNAMDGLAKQARDSGEGIENEWKDALYKETGDDVVDTLPQWKIVKNFGDQDSYTVLFCLSEENFPCFVNEAREIVMGQRNHYTQVEQLEKDDDEYDYVTDLEKYERSEAMVPTLEREMFRPTLIALDINLGPPGGDVKYGIVKQTCQVSGRIRTDYEIGMPLFPYNMGKALNLFGEERAMKVAHEGYMRTEALKDYINAKIGKSTEVDHAAHKYTFYDRWFALDKKFWTQKVKVDGKERDSIRVMWKNTDVAEKDRFVDARKTHSKLAKTAVIDEMFLRVTDTTPLDKEGKSIPKQRKMAVLNMLERWANVRDPKFVEARCLTASNIGHNTLYWNVRNKATQLLMNEFSAVHNDRNLHEEDKLHMIATIFAALDKVFTGLRSLSMSTQYLSWMLWFYNSVEQNVNKLGNGDQNHPMHRFLRAWTDYWRNALINVSEVKIPAACDDVERKTYKELKAEFVRLAHRVSDVSAIGEDMPNLHPQLFLDRSELANAFVLIEEESSDRSEKAVENFAGCKVADGEAIKYMLQAGFVLAQTPDHTAQVAFGLCVNDDSWTQMPDMKLTEDGATVKMVKRCLQCLRTPLAGNVFARWDE